MKKVLEDAIALKLAVWERSNSQMIHDIKAGLLSAQTQECMHIAHESFEAAKIKLSQDRFADAIYFFSRGSWKLGEVMGRAAYERKGESDVSRPNSESVRVATESQETD